MRKILITLRIVAFILVILLIFQPTKKVYRKRGIPTVAVLVDNSKSMEIISSSGFKNIKKKLIAKGLDLYHVKVKNKLIVDAEIEDYDNFVKEI